MSIHNARLLPTMAAALAVSLVSINAKAEIAIGDPNANPNLSVYGRLVAGVAYTNNIGPEKTTKLEAATNQWGTSLVGVKGATKINDDLTGVFNLETGFSAANGQQNDGTPGNLFGRTASIGLASKSMGTLEFGRALAYSNDAWYLDPMGMNWSGIDSLNGGHNWNAWKNTVGYRSPTLGGVVDLGVQTMMGGQSGNAQANTGFAFTSSLTLGNFNARLIYDETKDANGKLSDIFNNSKEYIIGANYKVGDATLFAAYNQISAPNAPAGKDTKLNHYWAGVNYSLGNNLFRLGFYNGSTNVTKGKATMVALGIDHKVNNALSFWASMSSIKNNENAAYPVSGYWNQAPVKGGSQQTFNTGLIYSF